MAETLLPEVMPAPTDGGAALLDWACRMREEHPVAFDGKLRMWQVFRQEHVQRVLTDHAVFSSDMSVIAPDQMFRSGNITQMDPPLHRKYRSLVNKAFTPRTVADLAPRISELTHTLLDEVDGADQVDLVDALLYPLPITVISELLGVPQSDHELFRSWVDNLFDATFENPFDPDLARKATEAVAPMKEYLLEHVRDRRSRARDDLITKLVQAEVDGERMTDEEVMTFSAILLLAGHVTTTLLLGNTVRCLDDNPWAVDRLRADPGLVPAAIEESLRLRPPFNASGRITTQEVELAGVTIPAQQPVFASILSANYDPARFADPHTFDLNRFGPGRDTPPHSAFGHGVHFCVGAPLARLEGRIALGIMLERYREIRLDTDRTAEYFANPNFNGPKKLPVVLR
ncbi:cytochrome P450 [Kitasatospora sp. NPDC087314]|uniref:cytochrome P450 n=1 Tax=Kitasatospora sp. NPDC087314 TaxID=3364068 RepID=UPI00380C3D93